MIRFIFVFLFIYCSISQANQRCEVLLGTSSLHSNDRTDNFIAYLSILLENQVIKADAEMLRLIKSLENAEMTNPIIEKDTWESVTKLIHHEEIQKYIEQTILDQKKLLLWAKSVVKEKNRVNEKREEISDETKELNQKIEFYLVPPGVFHMGPNQNKKTVHLTHFIEAMSTQVTQWMWLEEMGENPSLLAKGEHAIIVFVNGKPISFANRKSEKMGFKPTYDLSQIKWASGTSAETGNLKPDGDEEGLKLKINAPNGNIYEAEGFRLSTEAEKEYLLANMGKSKGEYPHDITVAKLKDYAWYFINAKNKTHPVGSTLKSFKINGQEHHDLAGNVFEWINDWFANDYKGGENPQGPATGTYRVIRGVSWFGVTLNLRTYDRDHLARPDEQSSGIGFRLVRTLKNHEIPTKRVP
ncbi:MAG: hypothetical protein A2Z20_03510 [Bdellovibrionales bacterium RBG_16_40_8]|nr:MAG: hypothetical protein A2Z20_03510 [Bdellovibrionales bacterium RBG_16_40_8]